MSDFDQWAEAVERVTTILKQRFPNLTVEETLRLAHLVVREVLAAHA